MERIRQENIVRQFFYWMILPVIFAGFFSCTRGENELNFEIRQPQIPVLLNKRNNQVLQLILIPSAGSKINVKEIRISLKGTTDLNDIDSVVLYLTGNGKSFDNSRRYGESEVPGETVVFRDKLTVADTTSIWLSVKLRTTASLKNKISANVISLKSGHGTTRMDTRYIQKKLRIGIALRQHGDDGVHTFRIPGLAVTGKGTLLAIYDVRRSSGRDLQGDIDIGMSRSTDGGNTWEPMRIILDMGKWGGLPEKFNGVSDANILVNKNDNTIFVSGLWMHGVLDGNGRWIEGLTDTSEVWEHQWRNKGSQSGFGVKESSQFLITKSTDDGLSWSEPVNITTMGKRQEWWLWAPSPGNGITAGDGTLIIPSQGRDDQGIAFSNITWSRDNGKTWHSGNPAYRNTTESAVVELSDRSVMLNMRHNGNRNNTTENNGRAVAITDNLGRSWIEHSSSRNSLIEPTCMGSLISHTYTENGIRKSILLFSNPDSRTTRNRMTIKVSFDDGKTWPVENRLLLDELRSNGYSCLTSIDEETIGILYEGSQSMLTFEKIPLSELLN